MRARALLACDPDGYQANQYARKKGTYEMHANSTRPAMVEPGGDQVAAHVGLHAIGCFADRLGLGDVLSSAIPVTGERRPVHDRGKVLIQASLMLAGGGESCLDIEHLRAQRDLVGSVPSDTTLGRTFHELDQATVDRLGNALAQVRRQVWRRSAATTGRGPVVLDLDASIVDIHSDGKEGTAPTYKGNFGFHPIFCFADATGECLAAELRPGNATANAVVDNLAVLDAGIDQLPEEVSVGHRAGDDSSTIRREVIARSDSAGCSVGFLSGCRERGVSFMVVARTNAQVQGAIFDAAGMDELWSPARRQEGDLRPGAGVIELTDEVDLSSFPHGTRLIIRREPLHPGAQQSLFKALDYRYWGFYTDCDGDPVELDCAMRAHAHVEDHILRLKESGLLRFPFASLAANQAWLFVVALAADLVRWFQLLCLDGALAKSRPKALRWSFLHAPGRLVRRGRRLVIRVLDRWPHAEDIVRAHQRIAALT
jgi:Transposase DDE domain group 1